MKYDREIIEIAPMRYIFDLMDGYNCEYYEIPEWRLIMMEGEI